MLGLLGAEHLLSLTVALEPLVAKIRYLSTLCHINPAQHTHTLTLRMSQAQTPIMLKSGVASNPWISSMDMADPAPPAGDVISSALYTAGWAATPARKSIATPSHEIVTPARKSIATTSHKIVTPARKTATPARKTATSAHILAGSRFAVSPLLTSMTAATPNTSFMTDGQQTSRADEIPLSNPFTADVSAVDGSGDADGEASAFVTDAQSADTTDVQSAGVTEAKSAGELPDGLELIGDLLNALLEPCSQQCSALLVGLLKAALAPFFRCLVFS